MAAGDDSDIKKSQWKIASIVVGILLGGMVLCGILNLVLMEGVVEAAAERAAQDKWTGRDMREWARELQRLNPDLKLPPAERRP